MPVQQRFLQFPIFGPLSPKDFQRVMRNATRHDLPAHTVIFQEGDAGDLFYMIVSGRVEIISGAEPNVQQLNLLENGAWFGELALIDGSPRSATARTLTPSVLVTLPKDEFRWLVTTYPLSLFILVSSIQDTLRERDVAFREQAEQRAAQLEQLYSTMLDITRHLERDQALAAIRDRAVELLASAGGELYLYDTQSRMLVPQMQEFLKTPARRAGEGCVGRAFATGEACIETPRRSTKMFELAAPIVLDSRALGVLSVFRASDGVPFQDTDRTLLGLFASQAAIVIENAQLYTLRTEKARLDGELNAAYQVQASLIPTVFPQIPGFQVAALWQPARQVSGDFYDFIPLADGRWAIVIADVSDKGMAAALFMALTRSTLRASIDLPGNLVEIVERANRTISHDAASGMFVTVFIGILDPQSHHFSYVNAGHNKPLLLRASDGSLTELGGGNLALGIMADFKYRSAEVELARGDSILFFTDGVTEATAADGDLFGDANLQHATRDAANSSARQLLKVIDARVRAFTGAQPQSDDITLVALKRN